MQDIIFYEEQGQSVKLGWNSSINAKSIKIYPASRKNVEHKKNVLLTGFETLEKKDSLHYPKSGMNQVIAKLMKKNNNSYVFPLDLILNSENPEQLLRRAALNLRLANKYKFGVVLASFAKKEVDQRSPELIRGLVESLGLNESLAKESLKKTFK